MLRVGSLCRRRCGLCCGIGCTHGLVQLCLLFPHQLAQELDIGTFRPLCFSSWHHWRSRLSDVHAVVVCTGLFCHWLTALWSATFLSAGDVHKPGSVARSLVLLGNCLESSLHTTKLFLFLHMSMTKWKGVLPRNSDFWEQWPSLTDKCTRGASQNTTKRVRQLPLKSRMETKNRPQNRRNIRNTWNLPLWPRTGLHNTCDGTLGSAVGLKAGNKLFFARQDISLATAPWENALDHSNWPAAINEFWMC